MAVYPGSERERRFSHADLLRVVGAVFEATGMAPADAIQVADSLVAADRRGIHSHGTLRVPEYVDKLTTGGVNPQGRPRLVSCVGGALVIDGDNAMGQVAAAFAMRAAIEQARDTKVAFAAVRGSNHCGALDHWVMRAARDGMIGLASTNALPTMAPWGGLDKIIGMNPFAAAFPADKEPDIVLDLAFGATAHGKIRVYHQKGEAIPEGWAYDAEGRPTTDAACRVEADMSTIKVGALYQNFSLAVFRRARHAHFAFETQVKFLGERALPTMLWLRLRVHIKRYATGGKRTRRSTSLGTSQCQTVM